MLYAVNLVPDEEPELFAKRTVRNIYGIICTDIVKARQTITFMHRITVTVNGIQVK